MTHRHNDLDFWNEIGETQQNHKIYLEFDGFSRGFHCNSNQIC